MPTTGPIVLPDERCCANCVYWNRPHNAIMGMRYDCFAPFDSPNPIPASIVRIATAGFDGLSCPTFASRHVLPKRQAPLEVFGRLLDRVRGACREGA